jgi:hypothetical protein
LGGIASSVNDTQFAHFCDLYEKRLHLPKGRVCSRECDAKIKHPLPVWHVGSAFSQANPRVLFVGKPHRGVPGKTRPSGLIDPREMVEHDLRHRSWPYWSYTREIAGRLFGSLDDGWDRIALTNLVKCTNVDAGWSGAPTVDQTSRIMAECCVGKLGVISAEILALQPTHVVFYTYAFFPDLLEELQPFRWTTTKRTTRRCGKKALPWWEREATAPEVGAIRVLITGHPERMKKDSYIRLIARWVQSA